MPRFREAVPIDDYVLDVLMRDIVGHDRQPAAYLVYVWLYGKAARAHWKPVAASLRSLAEETGLSKSAVQTALEVSPKHTRADTQNEHMPATGRMVAIRDAGTSIGSGSERV